MFHHSSEHPAAACFGVESGGGVRRGANDERLRTWWRGTVAVVLPVGDPDTRRGASYDATNADDSLSATLSLPLGERSS